MSDTLYGKSNTGRVEVSAKALAAATILCIVAATGCTGRKTTSTSVMVKPSPSPTPPGPALNATVLTPSVTWNDGKGGIIAQIKGAAATISPTDAAKGQAYQGSLRNGMATLYQQGKPTATLRADTIDADQTTHIVKGTGNVVLHSLASSDPPSIRADTMTWHYDADEISGSGNVLLTRPPDLQIPGDRFTADTAVRRFKLYNGSEGAASGSF